MTVGVKKPDSLEVKTVLEFPKSTLQSVVSVNQYSEVVKWTSLTLPLLITARCPGLSFRTSLQNSCWLRMKPTSSVLNFFSKASTSMPYSRITRLIRANDNCSVNTQLDRICDMLHSIIKQTSSMNFLILFFTLVWGMKEWMMRQNYSHHYWFLALVQSLLFSTIKYYGQKTKLSKRHIC